MFIQSKVRIAEEHIRNVMVQSLWALGLVIAVNGSLSISFDAIVYDKHKPSETMVTSYFNSRERQQSSAEMLKNLRDLKNFFSSKNTVNLNRMDKTDLSQMSDKGTPNNNAIHNARNQKLKISLKFAFDFSLFIQSKVRIAEEHIRNVMVQSLWALGLVIAVNGSLSIR